MYNINGKARGKWCGTYLDLVSKRTHGFSNDETSRHITTTWKKFIRRIENNRNSIKSNKNPTYFIMKNTHSFHNCFFPNSWFGWYTLLQLIWIDPVKLYAFPSFYNLIRSGEIINTTDCFPQKYSVDVFLPSFIYACFYQYGEPQGTSSVKTLPRRLINFFIL